MPTPEREAAHGLVAPLILEPGVRALVAGHGAAALGRALEERGASVSVLDPGEDAGSTRADRGLSAGTASPAFDLVCCLDVGALGGAAAGDLESLLGEASRLLGPSGMLLLALHDPGGLGSRLASAGSAPPAAEGTAIDRAALRTMLARHGFADERWLVPYPGVEAPAVIVDARLWGQPGGDSVARALIRDPVARVGPTPPATDPLAAFHAAIEAGRALDVADAFLLAAWLGGPQRRVIVREGLAWLVPPPDRRREWLLVREVLTADGAWQMRPAGSSEVGFSGPLAREPLAATLPVGRSGEDLVSDMLLSVGPVGSAASTLLRAWWSAASAALAGSPPGRLQYDVLPRNFVVTADGEWRFIPQELVWRFPLPPEVLAYRALRVTLSAAVLPRGRVKGLPASLSLDEAVRRIMASMGLRSGEEFTYLWAELEAEVAARLGRTPPDQVACKEALLGAGGEPLMARAFDLPVEVQLADLRAGALARDAREVGHELESLRAAGTAMRWQLLDREAELKQMARALERLEAELGQAREGLARRSAPLAGPPAGEARG